MGGSRTGNDKQITAQKPAYEVGAAVPLRLRPKVAAPPAPQRARAPAIRSQRETNRPGLTCAGSVAGGRNLPLTASTAGGDDDMLTEDELLLPEDRARPVLAADVADCGTGTTKKACKNCTCGLADMEAAEVTPGPRPREPGLSTD